MTAILEWVAVAGIFATLIGPFIAPVIVELAHWIRRRP